MPPRRRLARPRRAAALALTLALACTRRDDAPSPPPQEVPRAPVELLVEQVSRSGARAWYRMAPDGSQVAPWTGLPPDTLAVVPSPDGATLALLRRAGESGDDVHLWRSDRDGGGLTPLLTGIRVVHAVAWSPDGARLALSQSTLTETEDLWLVGRDGGGAVHLTPDPLPGVVSDGDPAFSPDGARLAFTSNRSGTTRLWMMDLPGGAVRQVFPPASPATEGGPAWSPDGTRLAFLVATAGQAGVGVARPDGTDLRIFPVPGVITSGRVAWSPDGRVLHAAAASGDAEILALDPESGASTNLTRHSAHDRSAVPLRLRARGAWRGLAPAARLAAGAPGAVAVAAGDLVRDGRPDLAILSGGAGQLRLLRGLGERALQPVGGLDVAAGPVALALADLSADGVPDAVALGPGALQVFRGGAGGPGLPTEHPLLAPARGLAVADLDGDGASEVIAIGEREGGTFQVRVHAVRAFDGELVAVLDAAGPVGGAGAACAGDVTGEGAPDLVVLTSNPQAAAVLFPGQGDVPLAAAVPFAGPAAGAADQPACVDLDGDRRADLVVLRPGAAPGTPGLLVMRAGAAGLGAPEPLPAEGTGLAAADLDRDGDEDLVVVRPDATAAALLRNLGDGRFAPPAALPVGGAPLRVTAADLDGDHWPDLAVVDAGGSVVVLWNLGADPG